MTNKPQATSRFIAIETLCKLDKTGLPVSLLFNKASSTSLLAGKERHLAMNLIYGVLRQRQYLDSLLQKLCRQPLKKLPPFVHAALAVGLYQIFFLDRIPESAAVNESVKAIKAARSPKRYQGFVNGVLRESIRQRHTLPAPNAPDTSGNTILNHPTWLTDRWEQKFGKERLLEICASNNKQPSLIIRTNSLRITRDEYQSLLQEVETVHPGTYAPNALVLPEYHGSIPDLPGYKRGYFQVQDEAAQLVSQLLGPFLSKGSYLDGCAGLGGKTSHLMELGAEHHINITAVEPEKRRSATFHENFSRLHPSKTISFFQGSLQNFSKDCQTLFDGILIDAPCSGTGVIGRHPDIRWNRKESELQTYHNSQLELLKSAAKILKPGGVLVYATCSLESEENEDVIQCFLEDNSNFTLTDCKEYLPKKAHGMTQNTFFCPHPQQSIDGFFAARLVLKR